MASALLRGLPALLLGLAWGAGGLAEAAETSTSATFLPARYISVKGDAEKFRAHHWMKDGYVGGLQELTTHATFDNGLTLEGETHALIDDNDVGASLGLVKDGLGFVHLDFTEFRKYYDGTGGTYYRFPVLGTNNTDIDLALDIGKFGVETGLTLEGWPELTFGYEREYKDGTKSRLTWVDTSETISLGTLIRKISPSWAAIDEIVDAFTLDAAHDVAGFHLTGEQRWEFVRSEVVRTEVARTTTATATNGKIRVQDMAPEATLMTTTLGADRRFAGERGLVATAYRFAHMDNREFETIIEMTAAGVVTNAFSNPEQKVNARADAEYDSHIWTGSTAFQLAPWLNLTTKLKSEYIASEGSSTYPADTSPAGGPDGTPERIELGLTDNRAVRWGEAVALSFTGLPRSALYAELELEQARALIREDQTDLVAPGTYTSGFSRETVTNVRRGVWTLGGRVSPWRVFDATAHVRHRRNNNDYDDQREAVGAGSARSAFIDMQNIHTNEFALRTTLKPCRWFRTSFRYQYLDQDYATAAQAQQIVKTGTLSHVYTYDVTLQPLQDLWAMASFSRQTAATKTGSRYGATTTNVPAYNGDVYSWIFSTDYAPAPEWALTGSLQYSRAENFNDFTAVGQPYGANYRWVDLTVGVTRTLPHDVSVGVEYGFSRYQTSSLTDAGGNYRANLLWLEASKAF